ncbi:hypothetical protein [Kineosporia babensis]|nr:hypothetical protein [Kineosporia babensis]
MGAEPPSWAVGMPLVSRAVTAEIAAVIAMTAVKLAVTFQPPS